MSFENLAKQLDHFVEPLIMPLGYEVVFVDVIGARQKTIRLFIDFKEGTQRIGIEDCIQVSKLIDEPLEAFGDSTSLFTGTYDLEVSSPGLERPLTKARDFERFKDQTVHVHLIRSLNTQELEALKEAGLEESWATFLGKQKQFSGRLLGFEKEVIRLEVSLKPKKKANKRVKTPEGTEVIGLPFSLVTKSFLEPNINWDSCE